MLGVVRHPEQQEPGLNNIEQPVRAVQERADRDASDKDGAAALLRDAATLQEQYRHSYLERTATECFDDLFGREYNEIEMERIVLREMEDITLSFSEITKDGEGSEIKILRKASEEAEAQRMPSDYIFMSAHHLSTKLQLKEPEAGSKLSCAICLEEIN